MNIFKWLITAAVLVSCFFLLQRLFMPKYASSVYEGNLIHEYYDEVKDHDVLIVGDCEVYENISPITLWEEYGITSFIRGSAQQLIWQSYYLLEETLRYEKPEVVIFNVLAMKYDQPDQPQREEYNRLTLDGMKPSVTKWKAVAASRMEKESILSYVFPLLRYHDRWSELSADDIQYFFNNPKVSINGFMIRSDIRPLDMDALPMVQKLPDYTFGENSYKYLDMMTRLCKENGIALCLIKAPLLYPHWYDQWEDQMVDYAQKNNLRYYNFLDNMDDIGLDFETDTYDGGLHLNVYGAEKFSRYFGAILQADYQLSDRRGEAETKARWDRKVERYNLIKSAQESEIQLTGKVQTFIVQE